MDVLPLDTLLILIAVSSFVAKGWRIFGQSLMGLGLAGIGYRRHRSKQAA